jgi:hypothetical protein
VRRELIPLFFDEEERIIPVGSMFAIGRTDYGLDYTYGVCEWANGARGAIVDLYEVNDDVDSEGKSLYEKSFGHRDSLYFVVSDINLKLVVDDPMRRADLWTQCPLIAEGIIARYAKSTLVNRHFTKMYEDYYEMEKCFYAIERQRRDAFAFNANLEDEFANGVHLRQEQEKIKLSLQRLLPFLLERHHTEIKRVAEAYIVFVKSKATKTINLQSKEAEERERNTKKAEKRRAENEAKNYKCYSLRLNVDDKKLERLYVMLSKRDDRGMRFIDGDLMKHNKVDKEILPNVELIKDENMRKTAINKYLFYQVFSGQNTDVQIVWTSDTNKLWYLINTLYNYKIEIDRGGRKEVVRLLEKSEVGPGIWQIVCSRFLNGKKRKVLDESTGKKVETSDPIEFKEKDFHKYSGRNSPRDTNLLDAIIGKIAPPRVIKDNEAIEEDMKASRFGVKAPKTAGELGDGFHDTSHKGRFE